MSIDGTIGGDNKKINELNQSILDLKESIDNMEISPLEKEVYVNRFEDFILSFDMGEEDSQSVSGTVTIKDGAIVVNINNVETRIGSDGNIIQ